MKSALAALVVSVLAWSGALAVAHARPQEPATFKIWERVAPCLDTRQDWFVAAETNPGDAARSTRYELAYDRPFTQSEALASVEVMKRASSNTWKRRACTDWAVFSRVGADSSRELGVGRRSPASGVQPPAGSGWSLVNGALTCEDAFDQARLPLGSPGDCRMRTRSDGSSTAVARPGDVVSPVPLGNSPNVDGITVTQSSDGTLTFTLPNGAVTTVRPPAGLLPPANSAGPPATTTASRPSDSTAAANSVPPGSAMRPEPPAVVVQSDLDGAWEAVKIGAGAQRVGTLVLRAARADEARAALAGKNVACLADPNAQFFSGYFTWTAEWANAAKAPESSLLAACRAADGRLNARFGAAGAFGGSFTWQYPGMMGDLAIDTGAAPQTTVMLRRVQ